MDVLIKHLDFLQASSERTCRYLSDKEINTIQFFCLGLLRRIENTTTSTKVLTGLLLQNHEHGFSIGILFRTLMVDTLISMNLLKLISDNEAQGATKEEKEKAVNEFCNTFLSDGLKETLNYIQDAKTFGMKTADETALIFKNMSNVYKPFFKNYQDDGTRPELKYNKKHTAKQLFENLAKSNDLKELSKIYDSYSYLSKYEHFGIVYFHSINENFDSKHDLFNKATEVFVRHNAFLHFVLSKYSGNDPFIKKQSQLANDYFLGILTT